jgi:WS/DGAT/MGAT family acyltransferase
MSSTVTSENRFRRLTSLDRMFLHLESRDWPGHFGAVAVMEGKALLDGSGQLRLSEIRERIDGRLTRVQELRRRLHFPGPLAGGPLWVDDSGFDIRHHVHQSAVESQGDDLQLLDEAARLYDKLLDRRRPLWELWFITGLGDSRVGILVKLHHSMADGLAAVAIMGSLFDFEPDAPDPAPETWAPQPVPGWWPLVKDSFRTRVHAAGRTVMLRRHPAHLIGRARVDAWLVRQSLSHPRAPATSLNRVVRSGRRIRSLGMDLGQAKDVAHVHGATVNDVALSVWAGGLRELMLYRGEIASVELITNMPISTRAAGRPDTTGNQWGAVSLPLPVGEADVRSRLDRIARITKRVKAEQPSAAIGGFLAFLSSLPFSDFLTAHQHSVNLKVTNVIGPPVPLYLFGARILDIAPITRLFGNVPLTLCVFSYAGRLSLVMTADATAFPDLDVLMEGMKSDWWALTRGAPSEGSRPAMASAGSAG